MFYGHVVNGLIAYIYESDEKRKINDIIVNKDITRSFRSNNSITIIQQLQQENKLLKAQLKAQTDRSDFIEDCIAEMAGVVYSTEETTT